MNALDVPTPAQVLADARALLSPRARAGLDALPVSQRASVALAIATGAHLDTWERYLAAGQPWPDAIEWDAK